MLDFGSNEGVGYVLVKCNISILEIRLAASLKTDLALIFCSIIKHWNWIRMFWSKEWTAAMPTDSNHIVLLLPDSNVVLKERIL